ncbi:MAG: AI-2E family transporter [Campylobacteraceae bacterium]
MSRKILGEKSGFLLYAAAFVIVIAGVKSAQSIISPFLLAIFIAVMSAPAVFWLEKLGLRRIFAFFIVTIVVVAFLSIAMIITWNALNNFASKLHIFQVKLNLLMEQVSIFLASKDIEFNPKADMPTEFQPSYIINVMRGFLLSFSKILSGSFMIFLMVAFILFETTSLGDKTRVILGRGTKEAKTLDSFIQNLKKFLAIRTTASAITGLFVGVALALLGIENAIFWGITAFFLNFIPVVGSIIAAIAPIIMTFIEHSLGMVFAVSGVYLFINIAIGNIIEPRFLGHGMGISALVVLLSLIFWGWVLGPIGMFLAVPLTMIIKLILEINPDTRWIAIALSNFTRTKKR